MNHATKAIEIEDIEVRVTELERAFARPIVSRKPVADNDIGHLSFLDVIRQKRIACMAYDAKHNALVSR
jgi:hypothetical protein